MTLEELKNKFRNMRKKTTGAVKAVGELRKEQKKQKKFFNSLPPEAQRELMRRIKEAEGDGPKQKDIAGEFQERYK